MSGIKGSIIGHDVLTATGQEITVSSDKTALKLQSPQVATVVSVGGHGDGSVFHGVSFVPVFLAFLSYGGSYYWLPMLTSSGPSAQAAADSATISFVLNNFPDGSYDIYYFISNTEQAT
jgi:hypothetical protein